MRENIFDDIEYNSLCIDGYNLIAIYVDSNKVCVIYYYPLLKQTDKLEIKFRSIKSIPEMSKYLPEFENKKTLLLINNTIKNNNEYQSKIWKGNTGIIGYKFIDDSILGINLESLGNPFSIMDNEKYIEFYENSNFNLINDL